MAHTAGIGRSATGEDEKSRQQIGRARGGTRAFATVILGTALVIHASLVWGIASQRFDASVPAASPRSVVWPLFHDAVTGPGPGADLLSVYHAGVQVSRGESPYAAERSPLVTPYYYIYRYPPIVAQTLGRILSQFSPKTAYRLWVGVIELSLFALLVCVWQQALSRSTRVAASILLLLNTPYLLEIHMGQFTFVCAAITAVCVFEIERRSTRPLTAIWLAVPLIAVSAVKQFPLVVTGALLRDPARRRLALAVVAGTLALLAPLLWADVGRTFADRNLLDDTKALYIGNFSLPYLVFATATFLGAPFTPLAWTLTADVMAVAILGSVALALWRLRVRDVRRAAGTLMAAFFLAYFRVWEHHYSAVMVAGVLVLAAVESTSASDRRPDAVGVLLAGLLLLAIPSAYAVLPPDPRAWPVAWHYLLPLPKVFGTLLIVLVGLASGPLRQPSRTAGANAAPIR